MENKTLKWIVAIGTVIVAFIITMIIIEKNKKEEYFNVIDIPETHHIYNRTEHKYLDTILSTGLSILKLQPESLLIRTLTEEVTMNTDEGEIELYGYITGGPTPMGSQYIIYVKDLPKSKVIDVLSHELIHLAQYESGKLSSNRDYITWKGIRYLNSDIPTYGEREWEKEATFLGSLLENEIKNILTKKNDTEE